MQDYFEKKVRLTKNLPDLMGSIEPGPRGDARSSLGCKNLIHLLNE